MRAFRKPMEKVLCCNNGSRIRSHRTINCWYYSGSTRISQCRQRLAEFSRSCHVLNYLQIKNYLTNKLAANAEMIRRVWWNCKTLISEFCHIVSLGRFFITSPKSIRMRTKIAGGFLSHFKIEFAAIWSMPIWVGIWYSICSCSID